MSTIIHTAWGFGSDLMLFAHHVNVATWARLSPSKIVVWTPDGLQRHNDDMYYEAARIIGLHKGHRHRIEASKPDDFGQYAAKTPHKPAHIADFVRMWALETYGGWWLDTDVVIRHNPGKSGKKLNIGLELGPRYETIGLCNAIMYAATPGLPAVKMWRTLQQQLFDPQSWNGHSVGLPHRMSKDNPELWNIWPNETCLWPTWDSNGKALIFGENQYSQPPGMFCLHLWESNNMDMLRQVTPDWLYTSKSLYAKLARND